MQHRLWKWIIEAGSLPRVLFQTELNIISLMVIGVPPRTCPVGLLSSRLSLCSWWGDRVSECQLGQGCWWAHQGGGAAEGDQELTFRRTGWSWLSRAAVGRGRGPLAGSEQPPQKGWACCSPPQNCSPSLSQHSVCIHLILGLKEKGEW